MKGKNRIGRVSKFYPKDIVLEKCVDLLEYLPQADDTGFFEIDGVRYGTVKAWARELGVSKEAIKERLKGVDGTKGKMKGGHVRDFYPENIVLELCADLIKKKEQS